MAIARLHIGVEMTLSFGRRENAVRGGWVDISANLGSVPLVGVPGVGVPKVGVPEIEAFARSYERGQLGRHRRCCL
jgi:hypothetical protein